MYKGVGPGTSLVLYFDLHDAHLADRQVRVAIQSALDKVALIQTAAYGVPAAASGLLTPSRCFSSAFGNVFPRDTNRSPSFLMRPEGSWSGWQQRAGDRLAFQMLVFPDCANLAVAMQAQLREVGIDLMPESSTSRARPI
jgi:ABC-type transport system substrate-binding protein